MFEALKEKFNARNHYGAKESEFLRDEDSNWLKDDKPKRKQKSTRRQMKSLERKNELLRYLKTQEGNILTEADIAEGTDMSNGHAHMLLKSLTASGHIKRIGKRGSYRYVVKRMRVNGKRKVATKPTTPKRVEQTAKRVETKRGGKVYDRVLAYITNHQGQFISYSEMAEALKVSDAAVGVAVLRLVRDGTVVRSLPVPQQGTKYELVEPVSKAEAPVVPQSPEPHDENLNNGRLTGVVESLIWEFLRATRSTDLLMFLTWLEQRNKK